MIKGVVVHLANELPILVDLYEAPEPHAQSVRCTNVRTVDGKRPTFVHDPTATFVFPWHQIRLIEMPPAPTAAETADKRVVVIDQPELPPPLPEPLGEEPDEDLLARIRSV
ncbi:MAG: hypothetical protein ABI725_02945 [Chloroflexota bacterium]